MAGRTVTDPFSHVAPFLFLLSLSIPTVFLLSDQCSEMAAHGCQVNLSFSDPKSQNYVSVSGTGAVSQDRDEMKKRWSEANKAW